MGGAASIANISHELLEESYSDVHGTLKAGPLAQQVVAKRKSVSHQNTTSTASSNKKHEIPTEVKRLLAKIGISFSLADNNSNGNAATSLSLSDLTNAEDTATKQLVTHIFECLGV